MHGCFTPQAAVTVLLLFLFLPIAYLYVGMTRTIRSIRSCFTTNLK